jgi:hypothetical protein
VKRLAVAVLIVVAAACGNGGQVSDPTTTTTEPTTTTTERSRSMSPSDREGYEERWEEQLEELREMTESAPQSRQPSPPTDQEPIEIDVGPNEDMEEYFERQEIEQRLDCLERKTDGLEYNDYGSCD